MIIQLLDAKYRYDREGYPVIQLFGVGGDLIEVTGFEPYFFAEERIAGARNIPVKRFRPVGYQSQPQDMYKIMTKDPKQVRELREMAGVVYEADILYKNRFLVDTGLGGMCWVAGHSGYYKKIRRVKDRENAKFRYMTFDIECLVDGGFPDPETSPVIMISAAFDPPYKGQKTLVMVGRSIRSDQPGVFAYMTEREMLLRFLEVVREYDPDILAGYNSNEFDIPYLNKRMEKYKIRPGVGRDGKAWWIKKFRETRVDAAGRVIVDALPLIRKGYRLKRYTLKNVARELLDSVEKHDVLAGEIGNLWENDIERLIDYARQDAYIVLRLFQDLKLLDKYVALAQLSGSLLQDVINSGQSGMIENFLLREFQKHGRVMGSKPDKELAYKRAKGEDELKGGAVLVPKKGLQENVVVLDYRSLYPSIMMAYNLCYSTVIVDERINDVTKSPSGGEFVNPGTLLGIVPSVLKRLLEERMEIKARMKGADPDEWQRLDAQQYALKILLNSFYGYSGYIQARLFSLPMANAVTSYGRTNILKTRDMIEKMGFEVLYGDTDSVFIKIDDDPEGRGREIAEIVTGELPPPMMLLFEAYAPRAFFVTKKRYALWLGDKMKIKGLETVRRDWCDLTSRTLKECLELILKEGRVDAAIDHAKGVIRDVWAGNVDIDDLILSRTYTKNARKYKSKQPHVQLIEKMKWRGDPVPQIGERVPFVIVSGKKLFADRAEDPGRVISGNLPIDTTYYVNKQLLPPLLRILGPFEVAREQLAKRQDQKELWEF